MTWDQNYRMLSEGEIIRATDEVQRDDGSWQPAVCVGEQAPSPFYTSHRVYRRATTTPSTDNSSSTAGASHDQR